MQITKRREKYKSALQAAMKLIDNKQDLVQQKISTLLNVTKEVPSKIAVETVDVVFYLNTNPKKTDQNIKTSIDLSHGWSSKRSIGVFTDEKITSDNKYITIGGEELIDTIKQNKSHTFDICLASNNMSTKINTIARYLTKTLPNKKYGTLTDNVLQKANAIANNTCILVNNEGSRIYASIGNTSMSVDALKENLFSIITVINNNKPVKLKTAMIKHIDISTTQSHGSVKLTQRDLNTSNLNK